MYVQMVALADTDRAKRLRQARIKARYSTAMDAAKALNMSPATYRCHENATRGFMNDFAQKYARFFRVSYEWLQTGKGKPFNEAQEASLVVGIVGAGAEIFPADDALLDSAPSPPGSWEIPEVLQVRGDSMYPAYNDGDLIYCKQRLNSHADAIGLECMVKIEGGQRLLKRVSKGSKLRFFTLLSYNAPPIEDVRIEWAAPVVWIKRR